ncbi:MAG: protein translocase SEC61 complex subunit gamma [Candidatus Woesearchaeota archaeon]
MVLSFSSINQRIRGYIIECRRVLRVTKKPDMFEFKTIVKVSALGMGVIGMLGFIIFFMKELLL